MLNPKGKSPPLGFIYSYIKKIQVIQNGSQHCKAWGGFGKMSRTGSQGHRSHHGLWSFHGAGEDNAESTLHPTMVSMWV